MTKLSTGLPGLLESPFFWLLLIVPATSSILALQYAVQARATPPASTGVIATIHHHPVTTTAGVRTGMTVAAKSHDTPPGAVMPDRQAAAIAQNRSRGSHQTVASGELKGAPSILPSRGQVPTTVRGPADDGHYPDIPAMPATTATPAVTADTSAVTRLTTGTGTALLDNPYLPDASSDKYDHAPAQGATTPDCPSALFRGGNAYARLRLALLGCTLPGG